MKARAALFPLLLATVATAATATDLLKGGQYDKAFDAAQVAHDPLTASEAALAMLEYRDADDRLWLGRAETAAREAVKANPQNPRAYLMLGSALGRKADQSGLSPAAFGLARECRGAYEKALNLAPRLPEASVHLARWHSGAYAKAGRISGGDPDTARKLAVQAQKDGNTNPYVIIQAGLVFLDLEDTARARALLERGVNLPARHAQDRDLQALTRPILAKLK